MKKKIVRLLLASLVLGTASMNLAQADESNELQQSLSIYGWLPSLDGNLKYTIPGSGSEPDREGESGIADALDMVLMGNYELRKDKFSFLADMVYLKMSASQETTISTPNFPAIPDVNVRAEQELTAWLLGFYGGYNVLDNGTFKMDAIGGLRYFSLGLDASFSLNGRSIGVSPSIENYDGVVGIRGTYTIDENWYLPYHFDIGAGDSDLTWQASASVGYMFNWGDVLLTYRYMHYSFGEENFVNDFDLYGPKIGLVFHF
ncbi:outer membrane protein [Sulfurovum sp. NBC37-1]|uniref:outer membrane protein n=1 Tax=Sulfurovum sp. (strain NBC37-1) TaxID=387093 RepID=UPI0001587A7A|nr:hypothetical protein [Sulfurovum sp. NBC37-1]BAF73318.1 conserved hypothetical protein [Sulfurovum sp. NBC37-1]